jgi:hypothetical protein
MERDRMSRRYEILFFLFSALLWSTGVSAKDVPKASQGSVFVPASYIELPFTTVDGVKNQIVITRLFVRNTDMNNSITVNSVRFYDPDGSLVKEFLITPITLSPLASISFGANGSTLGVPPYPVSGGRPSFIVDWSASAKVNTPIIENARVFAQFEFSGLSYHGLAFTPGQPIQ